MNTADKKTSKPASKATKPTTEKSTKSASVSTKKATKKTVRATGRTTGKKTAKALRQGTTKVPAAKATTIKDYELIILFSSREEVYKASLQKVLAIFKEHNTKITWKEDLGVRPLAYHIQKHLTGHYLVFYINTPAQQVKHLSKALHLEESLLRVMLIAHDKKSLKYLEKRRRDLAKKKLYKKTEAKKPVEKKPITQ